MQAWWSVFDKESPKLDDEPIAVFRDKTQATIFAATNLEISTVRAAFLYETDADAEFLANAESIW